MSVNSETVVQPLVRFAHQTATAEQKENAARETCFNIVRLHLEGVDGDNFALPPIGNSARAPAFFVFVLKLHTLANVIFSCVRDLGV